MLANLQLWSPSNPCRSVVCGELRFTARRKHNTVVSGESVKLRGSLLLLLMMHLVVHPMTHALSPVSTKAHAHAVCSAGIDDGEAVRSMDSCDLCRAGNTVQAAPTLSRIELLNPQWIPVRLQAVSYASLQVAPKLPSRAPPAL